MHSSISLPSLEKSAARMEGAIRGKLKFINILKVITYRGGVIYNGTGLDLFTCIHPFGHNQLNGIPLGQPAGIGSIADYRIGSGFVRRLVPNLFCQSGPQQLLLRFDQRHYRQVMDLNHYGYNAITNVMYNDITTRFCVT